MNRSREEIEKEASKILEAEVWTKDHEKAFAALMDEYPNEGPADDLIIAGLEEIADLLRISPESNL